MRVADVVGQVLVAAADVQVILELVARASEDFVLVVRSGDRTPDFEVLEVAVRLVALLPLVVRVVIGVEHLGHLRHLLPAVGCAKVHLGLSLASALRGDNDDTVGATCAVDGGRRSILEHVDALNLRGSDVADARHREAVDDVEGGVVLREGAAATYAYLHVGVGRAFRGGDVHAGELAGQCLGDVRHRDVGEVLRLHGRDGPGEVAFLHRAVADDHDLVECLGIFLQRHVQRLFGILHTHLARAIPDVGKDKGCSRLHARELEVAVKVGHSACLAVLHLHAHADQRFARSVLDRAREALSLSKGGEAACSSQQDSRHAADHHLHVSHKNKEF